MRSLLTIAVAAWLLAAPAEATCFGGSCEAERAPRCTRLPLFVRPTEYFVHLNFPSLESDVYEGKVFINVDFPLFNQKKRSLAALSGKREFAELIRGFTYEEELCEGDFILLHAGDNLDIRRVEVLRDSLLATLRNEPFKKRKIASRVQADGFLAIKLASNSYSSSQNVIEIAFTGKMRKDKRGIYVSTYNDGQKIYKHIVSQFQPTDARTAFPCFDEPRFRTNFTLALSHGSTLKAYGNTEAERTSKKSSGGLSLTRFKTTPKMPVHMLAFVIGQFDQLESTVNGVQVRVLTAPGKRNAGHFALQVATDSIANFEKYIDFKFPLTKLDVVAIADHDKDNTESWGLVFVRDTLLWIDDETKPDTKITTAVNVAHVVVHQWFGNLISAAWWSDLWITEGVAAQFAFRIVQKLYPFESEYFVRISTLSGVMQTDQPGQLHALSPPIGELQTTEQIYGLFDNLEFMKSGSMAGLMSELFHPGKYRAALRRLIRRRAYKTVTVEDYLDALLNGHSRKEYRYVVRFVETFSKFKGVPLVNVVIKARRVSFLIEPFAVARKSVLGNDLKPARDLRLLMRMVYGDGAESRAYETVNILAWGDLVYSQSIALPKSFTETSINYFKLSPEPNFSTYFRARYDDTLLDRLKLAVQNKWISPMDRLQLLDDHNQLVLAGLMPAETFGKFVEAYAQEDHSAVLIQMLTVSKTLADLQQTESAASIQPALMRVFETYGFQVTGDESFLMQRLRSVLLKSLITQGNQQVIEAAVKAFEEANGEVALFLRDPVYTAIAVSDSSHIDRLVAKLVTTKSYEEQMRLLGAMSLAKNKQALLLTLNWVSWSGLKTETVMPYVQAIAVTLEPFLLELYESLLK